jgi:hypothetical protein
MGVALRVRCRWGYLQSVQQWHAIPVAIAGVVAVGFLDEDRAAVHQITMPPPVQARLGNPQRRGDVPSTRRLPTRESGELGQDQPCPSKRGNLSVSGRIAAKRAARNE